MATVIEQHLSKRRAAGAWMHGSEAEYRGPVAYVDTNGWFDKVKHNNPLMIYVRDECVAKNRTYAQAQIEETVNMIRENKLGLK